MIFILYAKNMTKKEEPINLNFAEQNEVKNLAFFRYFMLMLTSR